MLAPNLMLAKKATKDLEAYEYPRYVMEPKLDGMRVGVSVVDGNVTIYSRTMKSQFGKLPHLEKAFAEFGHDFTIDGEIVSLSSLVETNQGLAPLGDFNATMRIMGSDVAKAVAKQANNPLVFIAFDLLASDGIDYREMPERMRRSHLEVLVSRLEAFTPYIATLPRFRPDLETYIAYTEAGGEGMMLKDTTAGYVGKRRAAWLKVKVEMTEDAVITGYKEGQGKYADTIGALVFSQYDSNGNLVEVGRCSGMDDATRYEIGRNRETFLGKVIEFKHFGYASEVEVEGFRHPVFVAFRDDKSPADCVIDG